MLIQKQKQAEKQSGFTLLEMLFVVGILAMFYGLVLTNFGRARTPQQLRSAQNELVSQIQKLRSYSLSGRRIFNLPAKYYILRLDRTSSPAGYVVQGIAYDPTAQVDRFYIGSPSDPNIETIPLPQHITIKSLELYQKDLTNPATGYVTTTPSCVQVAFAVPYGRTYIADCNFGTIDLIYNDPPTLNLRANSTLTVRLQRSDSTTDERRVTIYGLSGRVEAN